MSEATDEKLIAGLLEGDHDAVAEARRWIRGASSPYRRRLAADLEDLEQQVLLELVLSLRAGRFQGDSKLATYVRRMAHYKCLNRLRDSSRRQWVDVEDVELVADSPTPFEQAAGRQIVDRTLRMLSQMPEACRDLWRMIHEGLSYREMSEKVGVSPGTLRVRVLRCRQKALAARDSLESGV